MEGGKRTRLQQIRSNNSFLLSKTRRLPAPVERSILSFFALPDLDVLLRSTKEFRSSVTEFLTVYATSITCDLANLKGFHALQVARSSRVRKVSFTNDLRYCSDDDTSWLSNWLADVVTRNVAHFSSFESSSRLPMPDALIDALSDCKALSTVSISPSTSDIGDDGFETLVNVKLHQFLQQKCSVHVGCVLITCSRFKNH